MLDEIEAFLYNDADLLDRWQLKEWFKQFTPDCHYFIPSTDRPDGNPDKDLYFVRDDWFLLSQRVDALLNRTAWAESPHSTTHRMISNVRVEHHGNDEFEVKANILVHRSRSSRLDAYPAFLTLVLQRSDDGGFLIKERWAVLAMEELRPHGRLSILL